MLKHRVIGCRLSVAASVCLSGALLTQCKTPNESSRVADANTASVLPGLAETSLVAVDPRVEAAMTGTLIAMIKQQIQGFRDAHPKAHGCFDSVAFKVDDKVSKRLQNALFVPGRTYDAAIRFSHGSSNPAASDLVPDIHGFAVKLFLDDYFPPVAPIAGLLPIVDPQTGTPVGQVAIDELRLGEEHGIGERYYHSVDIIGINAIHEFMVNGMSDYRDFFASAGMMKDLIPHILANRGAFPEELSNPALAPVLPPVKAAIEAGPAYQQYLAGNLPPQAIGNLVVEIKNAIFGVMFNASRGGSEGAIAQLTSAANGNRTWDATRSTYQSFVPYRFGGEAQASTGPAVKYQWQAIDCATKSPNTIDNTQPPAEVMPYLQGENAKNFLSQVLKNRVQATDLCFALNAQVWEVGYPSLDAAAARWGDRQYQRIGEIRVPRGSDFMDSAKCEKLSFNPGHGPAEFQGAGEIQRARKLIYAAIETERNQQRLEQ